MRLLGGDASPGYGRGRCAMSKRKPKATGSSPNELLTPARASVARCPQKHCDAASRGFERTDLSEQQPRREGYRGNFIDTRAGFCSYSVLNGLGVGEVIHHRPRHKTRNEEIVAELRKSAGAGPPVDPAIRVKRLVAEAAIQMALLHGGDWRVQFEPENGLVVVSRRRRRPREIL